MGRPGVIAFPVLLVLGAITGYLAYDWMVVKATPLEGIYDNSPYRKELAQEPEKENTASAATESESSMVTITILKGSSAQGSPDYDPDSSTVPLEATIRWVNDDSTLHSATSGTGFSDEDYGSLFDTKFLAPGKEYSIAASDIGTGEYTYFCQAHPYMVGTLTIE